jgi:PAS domain S-box-containing protein
VAGLGGGLLVFLAVYAGLELPRVPEHINPVGLGSATLLALLLLAPRERWPVLAAAGCLAGALAGLATGARLHISLMVAATAAIQCLVCAEVLLRMFLRAPSFNDVGNALRFALVIAGAAVGGALLGAGVFAIFARDAFWPTAFTWAARDFTGMATLTPCVIELVRNRRSWRTIIGFGGWPLALLVVVDAAVFLQNTMPLTYLGVVALMLVTWRLRLLGAAAGVLATLAITLAGTLAGLGPFAMIPGDVTQRLLWLQLFLTACFYISVPVAAQLDRARRLQLALSRALSRTRASEARHRLITESMGDIVLQHDTDERILYVTPSCRALGYEPAELIGRRASEFMHPEEVARFTANRTEFLAGTHDTSRNRRHRLRHKDGTYRWYEGSPSPIRDASGAMVGIVNTIRDVHEQHAADAALKASEARYRLLADNMNDIVVCYGADAVLTFVSGATEAALGYTPSELIGTRMLDLAHPDDKDRATAAYRRHREAGPGAPPFRADSRLFHKDGSVVWLEANPRAIFDADGNFVEWQDVLRNVTRRKALEDDLRRARAQAEHTATANAQFLIDMSHEFRGPLNSALGFARLAHARVGLRGPVRTYIDRMEDACRGLLAVVNDVLDFSRLEAKQVVFRAQATRLAKFVRAVIDQFEPQATSKGLKLELIDRTPAGLVAWLDQTRLRQVLFNLIGNAVKFTSTGSVSVELSYSEQPDRLSVVVRDTGPGIPVGRANRLFKRFSQLSDKGDRAYAGAGLGLAISKGIVEGLGGEISVESAPGEGSAFSFWLPAAREAEHDEDAADLPANRLRILVADPDPMVRRWLAEGLAPLKAEILMVEDGGAALRTAVAESLDVILLGLALPKVTAATVVRRLRAREGLNATTPVLAYAAASHDGLYDKTVEQGFQGLLEKHLSSPELISVVAHSVALANDIVTPVAGNA